MLFLLSLLVVSCFNNESGNNDLKIRDRYFNLENRGWKSKTYTQNISDINYTATEVPLQYYILKDIGSQNVTAVDSVYISNSSERIIEFEFLHEEEKDLLKEEFTKKDYKSTIEYLSFQINKDFYAVTAKHDTIKCEGVSYERNFKTAPYQRILLFFTNIPPNDKIQIIYNDRLFGNGFIKFEFEEQITPLIL